MDAESSFQAFEATYNGGKPQVLWTRTIADLETPVSAMIKLVGGAPKSFFLESVEGGSIRGRYSFLDMQPDLIWRCHGNSAEINRNALQDPSAFQPCPVSEDACTWPRSIAYWPNSASIYRVDGR